MVVGKRKDICAFKEGKSESTSDIFLRALNVEFIDEKIELTDLFLKSAWQSIYVQFQPIAFNSVSDYCAQDSLNLRKFVF